MKANLNTNPFKILGIEPTLDEKAIKSAFRALVRTLHPDLHPEDPQAEERLKEINNAWDELKDPKKREFYYEGATSSAYSPHPFRRNGWAEAEENKPEGSTFADDIFTDLDELIRNFYEEYRRRQELKRNYNYKIDPNHFNEYNFKKPSFEKEQPFFKDHNPRKEYPEERYHETFNRVSSGVYDDSPKAKNPRFHDDQGEDPSHPSEPGDKW